MAVSLDLPQTQRAIVVSDKLDFCIRDDVPLPPIADDCVIVKTEYVALNPVDTKMVGPFVKPGAVYGVGEYRIMQFMLVTNSVLDRLLRCRRSNGR